MLTFLNKIFDSNEKEINKIFPLIKEINSFEGDFKKLKDEAFAKKTKAFKERISQGEPIEEVLPETFALAREASRRTTGLRPFDVQLIAGVVLASGKIAEQKTGEGKTLSAVAPLYLHALTGKSVHLVTVNDYLARRDAGWMGPIFNLLDLSVSSIISEESFLFDPDFSNNEASDFRLKRLRPINRKEAYGADVVYGINSEFGFDYLRDNMAQDASDLVQRGYYFAIVDEVDSVLIDEARTPHIISAPDESPTEKYFQYADLIEKLNSDSDFKIDEKLKTAHLTDKGIEKVEKMFGISDIYEKDFDTVYHLEAALKAKTLFHKEKDYIVKDNEVILVDEFTGRLMIGRRLSEGLHQAIEAKEKVPIQKESKTLATVSLQNYFRMYEKLAGMTGTAVTEAAEFHKIYGLDVVVIPTNKTMIRRDENDVIYKTGRAKYSAVADEISEANKKGQPVLVGTTSIDKNMIVSELLKRRGIKHEVLNAKNHEREAEIIAKAGEKGAITVATNMAGRGVDIVLGGESPKAEDGQELVGTKTYEVWQKKHDEVISLGGLYVIGTERHESRRIDNQLRGRSGRQGDPGRSKFFVGLDDEIMRLFGGETISGIMTRFNMPEDVPLQHGIVSKSIESAQSKVERFNFDIRKHLVEYDDVLNKQREIIYRRRRNVLESVKDNSLSLKEDILEKIAAANAGIVAMSETAESGASSNENIVSQFATMIPFDEESQKQLVGQIQTLKTIEEKTDFLDRLSKDIYEKREKDVGEIMRTIERFVVLGAIDSLWTDHLDAIDNLREGIGLRGYGQKDPLVEYKNEAFTMFEKLINAIDDEIVHRIFRIQIASQPHVHHDHATANVPASEVSEDKIKEIEKKAKPKPADNPNKKLGRNDPCWCGSGKKYKKCHWPN